VRGLLSVGHLARLPILTLSLLLLTACGARSQTRPDAGTTDGGAPPVVEDVDVIGTWRHCGSTLELRPDGTARLTDHYADCTTSGTHRVEGRLLWMDSTSTDCEGDVESFGPVEVVRPAHGLVLVGPETGSTTRYSDGTLPIVRWAMDGARSDGLEGHTTARLVGTPGEGLGSGCYWSTDRECGGLSSCAGTIGLWETEGSEVRVRTSCGGYCPCGTVIIGTARDDGSFEATFAGSSCEGTFEGTLTAVPTPER